LFRFLSIIASFGVSERATQSRAKSSIEETVRDNQEFNPESSSEKVERQDNEAADLSL
jgi:hypothetical protein